MEALRAKYSGPLQASLAHFVAFMHTNLRKLLCTFLSLFHSCHDLLCMPGAGPLHDGGRAAVHYSHRGALAGCSLHPAAAHIQDGSAYKLASARWLQEGACRCATLARCTLLPFLQGVSHVTAPLFVLSERPVNCPQLSTACATICAGVCRACSNRDATGSGKLVHFQQQFARDLDPASPTCPQTLGEMTERLKARAGLKVLPIRH